MCSCFFYLWLERMENATRHDGHCFSVCLFVVAKKLAEDEGIAEHGYRLLINCGVHGHQEVFHLHMHLVGGKSLGRMLSPNIHQE